MIKCLEEINSINQHMRREYSKDDFNNTTEECKIDETLETNDS